VRMPVDILIKVIESADPKEVDRIVWTHKRDRLEIGLTIAKKFTNQIYVGRVVAWARTLLAFLVGAFFHLFLYIMFAFVFSLESSLCNV
jgi:hypothetical protein